MQWKKVTHIKNKVMTKDERDLLIKDIFARIPYGVKGINEHGNIITLKDWKTEQSIFDGIRYIIAKYSWRPYLFPLESITIEQKRELSELGVSYCEYALHDDIRGLGIMVDEAYIFYEFCYKHHIDFLDLIEKGLAINATGLNIY